MKKLGTLILIVASLLLYTDLIGQVKMPIAKETRKITYTGDASSELGSVEHNVNKLVGWINFAGVPLASIKVKEMGDHSSIMAKTWFPAYYILKTPIDPKMEEKKSKGIYDWFINRGDEYGQIRYDINIKVYKDRIEYTATNFEHFYPNRMAQTCGPLEPNMGKNTTKDYWLGYKMQAHSYMTWLNERGMKALLSLNM